MPCSGREWSKCRIEGSGLPVSKITLLLWNKVMLLTLFNWHCTLLVQLAIGHARGPKPSTRMSHNDSYSVPVPTCSRLPLACVPVQVVVTFQCWIKIRPIAMPLGGVML